MIYRSNLEKKIFNLFDICIVGSGIAASSLIIELLDSKFSIVIIEAGDLECPSSKLIQKDNTGRKFGKNTTAIEVGGTSNLWHGVLSPLDQIDFKKRSWINESGWPISYKELSKYYLKACSIFKIENFSFFKIKNLPSKLNKILSSLIFKKKYFGKKSFSKTYTNIKI